MPESLQHKLDRVRPPRVQITYDVEIGGAIQMKELPFVVGILADLSGKPETPLPKLKERKFVEIDRDNFNDVMKSIRPTVALRTKDVLSPKEDGAQKVTAVKLSFEHIDDFGPLKIIDQVAPLKKLFDARQRLSDLLAKLDGNDTLDFLLTRAALEEDGRKRIAGEVLPASNGQSAAPRGDSPTPAPTEPETGARDNA